MSRRRRAVTMSIRQSGDPLIIAAGADAPCLFDTRYARWRHAARCSMLKDGEAAREAMRDRAR